MNDPIIYSTTRYLEELDNLERIREGIEDEVYKTSIPDLIVDIYELVSHTKLEPRVWAMVRAAWRAFEPRNELDDLLEELYTRESLPTFLSVLGLEDKFREMIIEYRYDQEVNS